MASEYLIKTTKENRTTTVEALSPLGIITERWKDGSFNFEPYDNDCEDELVETCETLEIECELL